jgi:glycosyltransferase involved in cell wall biosynthesis
MTPPTVSVIIPTHNRAKLLPRAVESVVAQTFDDWELVVVDDGSDDETPQLASQFSRRLGPRWVYMPQTRRGCSAARNRGIDAARGPYVAFLDSDDEFAPDKLQRQLDLFERRPDLGFVYSDFSFIDLDGIRHPSAFEEKFPIARSVARQPVTAELWACDDALFDVLLRGYFIATIVGMVRREVLGPGIRFAEDLCYAEEWLFFLHVARTTRSGWVDAPLSIHHYTPGSLARTGTRSKLHGYRSVLLRMLRDFPDLSRRQRLCVRFNLAETSRRLGYLALQGREPGAAVRHFSDALRRRPGLRTLSEVTAATLGLFRPQRSA